MKEKITRFPLLKRSLATILAASLLAASFASTPGEVSFTAALAQATEKRPQIRPVERAKVLAIGEVTHDSVASLEFVLQFDKMPNFATTDTVGRLADSFQFFIAFDRTTKYPANPTVVDVVLRPETTRPADGIRVRSARPPAADRTAGGWGTLRGSVPYTVNAKGDGTAIVTFVAPRSLLGASGKFAYQLEIYEYGGVVQSVRGVAPYNPQ